MIESTDQEKMAASVSKTIGPHAVEKNGNMVKCHVNGKYVGEYPQWECKYCGMTGSDPASFTWHKPCEGFEWEESEKLEHNQWDSIYEK